MVRLLGGLETPRFVFNPWRWPASFMVSGTRPVLAFSPADTRFSRTLLLVTYAKPLCEGRDATRRSIAPHRARARELPADPGTTFVTLISGGRGVNHMDLGAAVPVSAFPAR